MDYLKIITYSSNWVLFKDIYSDPNKEVYNGTKYGKSQKEKATHWFSKLNEIRKKVSHPERAAVTESEFKFLKNLESWLISNIDIDQGVEGEDESLEVEEIENE